MATLIVKISYGEEIHRVRVTLGSFEGLQQLVEETFPVVKKDVIIKYVDTDGDKVTISSDRELREAIVQAVSTSAAANSTSTPVLRLFAMKKETSRASSASQQQPAEQQSQKAFFPGLMTAILETITEQDSTAQQPSSDQQPQQAFSFPGLLATILEAVHEEDGSPSSRRQTPRSPQPPRAPQQPRWQGRHSHPRRAAQQLTDDTHLFVQCDGCNANPIIGNRYKCVDCPDYDLCNDCIEKKVWKDHFDGGHVFRVINRQSVQADRRDCHRNRRGCASSESSSTSTTVAVHHGVSCDGCGAQPILGVRHKCIECLDYDLCSSCKEAGTHSQHTLKSFSAPIHFHPHCWRQYAAAKPEEPAQGQIINTAPKEEDLIEKKPVAAPVQAEEQRLIIQTTASSVPERNAAITVAAPEKAAPGQEEEVIIAEPTVVPFRFEEELQAAKQMGFINEEIVRSLLERTNGDLLATVNALLQL